MSKIYVIGDIHGRHKALLHVLQQVNFDYEEDMLISLGDIFDRGDEPYKCIFELLKMKHCIPIVGNHDVWARQWIENPNAYKRHFLDDPHYAEQIKATKEQWPLLTVEEQEQVKMFLKNQLPFYVDENRNLFVHGGIYRDALLSEQTLNDLCMNSQFFDRELMSMQRLKVAKMPCKEDFNEIFVGHVATISYKKEKGIYRNYSGWVDSIMVTKPINILNVWNLDTGAGFHCGKLTLMNLETKEYVQSNEGFN